RRKPCVPAGRAGPHQRWIAMVTPPGAARSKPTTPRAGRRRDGGLAVIRQCSASASRDAEVRGSVGPPASRATLTGAHARRRSPRAKPSGRRSVGFFLPLSRLRERVAAEGGGERALEDTQ